MTIEREGDALATTARSAELREQGLHRGLSQRQLTMIGIGGAIGTGLFMGSGLAVGYAGPGVVISYAIAALIALIVMYSLSEMAVANPIAGSFGSYAESYISPLAGFVVRTTYWATMVILIGSEAIAVGHYMEYWAPGLPVWVSTLAAGGAILFINTRAVGNFGTVEYWLSAIKVSAIVVFIAFGLAKIFGLGVPATGFGNYLADGGPLPFGLGGVWMGVIIALFSFLGIEMIAVAAGEAEDPQKSVPRAMRSMLIRLLLFYILAIGIIVAIAPWSQSGGPVVEQGPFVKLFTGFGLPAAASLMNFVVMTAALSAMNSALYMAGRMTFSLARSGEAPAALGILNAQGVPARATAVSSLGTLVAAAVALVSPNAFQYLVGIALFGGLFTWVMILVTHFRFRRLATTAPGGFRAPLFPWLQIGGLVLMAGVFVSMALDAQIWRTAIIVGLPWLAAMVLIHWVKARVGR